MKLLINICAHDGIISHYTGVGTMVGRYIAEANAFCKKNNFDYKINLITPQYNTDSFGYSTNTYDKHKSIRDVNIIQVSNGSSGNINFGTVENWEILCSNTAKIINNIEMNLFDKIITICNDAPFAGLIELLNKDEKHFCVWIPHSTIKIHKVDSAIPNSELFYLKRLDWEQRGIDYINTHSNCFVGCVAEYMKEHLIEEYSLFNDKAIDIINGEDLKTKTSKMYSTGCKHFFDQIKHYSSLIMAFGRAEDYKNLDAAFDLGKALNIQSLVIAQSYYKDQPILTHYKERAMNTSGCLFLDPPFDLPKYIMKNYNGLLIVLVPSKAEIFGLIINETRKLNRDNILIVSNKTGGLTEQINDGVDGLLIDINNIEESALKINQYLNLHTIKKMNEQSQIALNIKYNFELIFENFINKLIWGVKDDE